MRPRNSRGRFFHSIGVASTLMLLVLLSSTIGLTQTSDGVLNDLRTELIPIEGAETAYGIALSLESLPQFVEWWSTLVPDAESDSRYSEALLGLVAPCCDDNPAYQCCCETGDSACNLIRSGKGLAAHLILDLDFEAEDVAASVLEWFRFARPDYYLAVALEDRGLPPRAYGLTTWGSCYRGMCNVPISEGGCGGMKELIEPALDTRDT